MDVSNSFTKYAISQNGKIGRIHRCPTSQLNAKTWAELTKTLRWDHMVVSSVVPAKNSLFKKAILVHHSLRLGIAIDYPQPEKIGADRLANAAACAAFYGCPAIAVDFGTAVTFDIISADCAYIGGVIAPGLSALTDYLHEKTALLPKVELREPKQAVGKSTEEAMLIGAVYGYRGLIREIIQHIRKEAFPKSRSRVIATGGYARLISKHLPVFETVDEALTLKGLQVIGDLNLTH